MKWHFQTCCGPRAPEALHPGGHKYHRWQLPFIRRYSIEPSTAHLPPCHLFGNPFSSVAAAYYPVVDKCESTAVSLLLWRGRGILFRREQVRAHCYLSLSLAWPRHTIPSWISASPPLSLSCSGVAAAYYPGVDKCEPTASLSPRCKTIAAADSWMQLIPCF